MSLRKKVADMKRKKRVRAWAVVGNDGSCGVAYASKNLARAVALHDEPCLNLGALNIIIKLKVKPCTIEWEE